MITTIVSGASENHAKSLIAFLESMATTISAIRIYVWDFGLSVGSRRYIEEHVEKANVVLRTFDFSKYPAYFDIGVAAGQYAWKPAAIWETALEVREGVLLWCDAGNRLNGPMEPLRATIEKQGVYSPISAGTVRRWTHPGTVSYMDVPESMLEMSPRNGAIIGFDLSNIHAWGVLGEWYRLAQIQDCIAPEGSDRSNHRQDQAVLTVLYYQFMNGLIGEDQYISMLTHCDID